MTYAQFLARFGAALDNTEGFTVDQLKAINRAVFDQVQHLDVDGYRTADIVQNAFEKEFGRY